LAYWGKYLRYANYSPTNHFVFFPIAVLATIIMSIRDTHIAVKSERMIPRPSMNPNPEIIEIPKI
jgi:hypothetical protein